jgi:hypothetical protein
MLTWGNSTKVVITKSPICQPHRLNLPAGERFGSQNITFVKGGVFSIKATMVPYYLLNFPEDISINR